MGAAAKKTGARANPPKQKPVQAVELPKPDDLSELPNPYPEAVQVYAYQPKDGSTPILLALDGFDVPDKLWHFDIAQLPLLAQTWKWMERANIPKSVQRQALSLSDSEYFEMFDEWFDVMRKMRGAVKGAVTPGK